MSSTKLYMLLCGGRGTRLWPLSRRSHPKQFLLAKNQRTLLENTVSRIKPLLDNDGDLDIVMNGFDEEIRIYRNELKSGNSVRVILEGSESNVQGLGCKVIATYDEGKKLTRYLSKSLLSS